MSQQQQHYYLLLSDQRANKKEKTLIPRQKFTEDIHVLQGSLWTKLEDSNTIEVENSRGKQISLVSVEYEGVVLQCNQTEIERLDDREVELLYALNTCAERYKVFKDKNWLAEGIKIGPDAIVYLLTLSGLPEKVPGKVKYKGPLEGHKGTWFGVELSAPYHGKGTTDGVFRKHRYFTCPADSGVYVPINKIRLCHDHHLFQDGQTRAAGYEHDCDSPVGPPPPLSIKERVVWISDNGPEFGEVKWIGNLPDSRDREWTVGVEFDNPVGTGTGKYKDKQLFRAKQNHASLVPILGLIKESEFLNPSGPPPEKQQKRGGDHPIPPARTRKNQQAGGDYTNKHGKPEPMDQDELDANRPVVLNPPAPPLYKRDDYSDMQSPGTPPGRGPRSEMEAQSIYQNINKNGAPQWKSVPSLPHSNEHFKTHERFKTTRAPPAYDKLQDRFEPVTVSAKELDTDIDIGSMVEVPGTSEKCRYGVVRWLGYLKDKTKPVVGLEMEEESASCTDGTFASHQLFRCPPRKAFFVYLNRVRKDPRFLEENSGQSDGSNNTSFGNLESPEVPGTVPPIRNDLDKFYGKNKGIQGHHNSCYLDATLFSLFAFSVVSDSVLYRPRGSSDLDDYEEIQRVLKESIVNPLRKNAYVRADKVLQLRTLLDSLSNVQGLMSEEKDPEEFINLLLQQILKAEPFIKLSNGQESYLYQLFIEKDDNVIFPTTQQLLSLSFYQSDIKLAEVPPCLILQMPRFGKDYKMYNRIIPSLTLDITDILEYGPRECIICASLAEFECKECYKHFGDGLDHIAFCQACSYKTHQHAKRTGHQPKPITVPEEYKEYRNQRKKEDEVDVLIEREKMELFAVVCIERSHYVSFVKCGTGPKAPWVFFDSMADRIGQQNGYNIPEVKPCPEINDWLTEDKVRHIKNADEKNLPEPVRRLLCDSYMCMYQSCDIMMYN